MVTWTDAKGVERQCDGDIIDAGLGQMPSDGLRRLIAHIEAGKPLLLNGALWDKTGAV